MLCSDDITSEQSMAMADYNTDRRFDKVKDLCTKFKELKQPLTLDHVMKLHRDVFEDVLKKTQTQRDDLCIKQVVTVLYDKIDEETLESPSPVGLEKRFVLRTCIGHLLRMWQQSYSIDGDVFTTVVRTFNLLLSIKSTAITVTNIDTIKSILLEESFIEGIILAIKKASTSEMKNPEKPSHKHRNGQIPSGSEKIPGLVVQLLQAYHALYISKTELHDDEVFSHLIKALSNYFISPHLDQLVMQLTSERTELNEFEKMILVNAAPFFFYYKGTTSTQLFLDVRKNILIVLRLRVAQFTPSEAILQAIKHLSATVVYSVKTLPSFHSNDCDNCFKLIEQLCETIKQHNGGLAKNSRRVTCSVKVLLRILYYFTNHPAFLKHIQSCDIRPVLLKLIDCDEEETTNYSKQILAVISSDNEIIQDRQEMTSTVVTSMKLSVDNEEDAKCLQSSLRGIQVLIREEEQDREFPTDGERRGNDTVLTAEAEMDVASVKDEIITQDGIPPLVQCATEQKFAKLKAQEPAMKVLLKLAFHKGAVEALKKYPELVEILKAIFENDEDTPGVLEEDMVTLLWKLTRDQKGRRSARGKHEQYDIMLSYCHDNKDVCNKIYRYLTSNYNYKVWIDQKCLRNRVRDGMAKAVESSKIVIICLSDSYTDSSACRCEAEYAFQLNRGVIPLYVQPGFRIKQGWLFMMINGLRYLDYHKLGIANIFKELKNEIDGYMDLPESERNSPSPPPSRQKQAYTDNEKLARERDDLRQISAIQNQKIQELKQSLQISETQISSMKREEERLRGEIVQKTLQLEEKRNRIHDYEKELRDRETSCKKEINDKDDKHKNEKEQMQVSFEQRHQELLAEKDNMQRQLTSVTTQSNHTRNLIQNSWQLPTELQTWTQSDVEVFLYKTDLAVLLPYFGCSDGSYLLRTYHRCLENPDEMLRQLQDCVGGQDKLNKLTFDRLLHRLEQYVPRISSPVSSITILPMEDIPIPTPVPVPVQSRVCTIM